MRHFVAVIFLFMGATLLTGCLSPTNSEAIHQYDFGQFSLGIKRLKTMSLSQSTKTLLISRPRVAIGYESTRMAYMTTSHEVNYYATHRWIAPPAQLLQSALVQAFQQQHRYRFVVASPFNGLSDERLETELLYLRHVIQKPGVRTEIGVCATWINVKTQRVICQKTFEYQLSSLHPGPDIFRQQTHALLELQLLPAILRFSMR